jgi:hypothetical protein
MRSWQLIIGSVQAQLSLEGQIVHACANGYAAGAEQVQIYALVTRAEQIENELRERFEY